LQPGWKVLALDGVSPLAADFQPDAYPLTAHFTLAGSADALVDWSWRGPVSLVNRDAARLTRLAMTGVTALVRATAYAMERHSVTYPGEEVAAVLRSADIAHISNEVAFTPDCPYPDPIGGTTFCSQDRYFELLQYIGADVIELTGNHVNDWGRDALAHTLDMYAAAGLAHFGGGHDAADAARPAEFEDHGNRIALLGCNPVGPAYAWAAVDAPGSRPCDATLAVQVSQLTAAGQLVFATLQYNEFYFYPPTPQQQADFRALIDAGAIAVSGSQGHHAQGFELYRGGFIHYGLGNLFFDQMDQLGTRQTFIDTYVIYAGRLIGVELFTGLIEDYARPRLMTPDERRAALSAVFDASIWP
jgi:poly-gamma-glutamate synthesis protein (capsule biosynthesis protein)